MVLRLFRIGSVVAVVVTVVAMGLSVRQAVAVGPPGSVPGDPYYNYYVPPDPYYGVGAKLYPSPRPTPPMVGHTYITYEPLAPHEFLYTHHRVYNRYNPDGSVTRTTVGWKSSLFPWASCWDRGKFHDVPRMPIIGK